MGKIKYKLTRKELAIQIHHSLREIYPDRKIIPEEILECLDQEDNCITFMASEFAETNVMEAKEFINKLYLELGIEYEKNLHDKFYFVMTRDNKSLHFKMVENDD